MTSQYKTFASSAVLLATLGFASFSTLAETAKLHPSNSGKHETHKLDKSSYQGIDALVPPIHYTFSITEPYGKPSKHHDQPRNLQPKKYS